MKRTNIRFHSPQLEQSLPVLQEMIRKDHFDDATVLLAKLGGMTRDWARTEVHHEAEFLRAIDASIDVGATKSRSSLTPRQALIMAALTGWNGDDFSPWQGPISQETLIAWAESYYRGPEDDISVALAALLRQGLFFEVHPAVFDSPAYFCTYDHEFLEELPDGGDYRDFWESLTEEYDEKHQHTWRTMGLCEGQGSQSSTIDGPCLGSCCSWYRDGKENCGRELTFRSIPLG